MGVLRFLLALAVIIGHAAPIVGVRLLHPSVAVQAFYLISGFYMALILNERYVGPGSTRLFLTNRALRIYPTYWACLAFAAVVVLSMPHSPFEALKSDWDRLTLGAKAFLVFANVFVFGQDWTLFQAIDPTTHGLAFTANFWGTNPKVQQFLVVPQAWSLGVELTFYIVAVLLLRRKTLLLCAVTAAALLLRGWAWHRGYRFDPWTYRFFPFELGVFLLGALSYRLLAGGLIERLPRGVPVALGLAAIAVTLALPFDWSTDSAWQIWPYYGLLVLALPCLFHLCRRLRWDGFIGELSFPMYLLHIAVIWAIDAAGVPVPWGEKGLLVTVATIALSILLCVAVVVPIDKVRARRLDRAAIRPQQPRPDAGAGPVAGVSG